MSGTGAVRVSPLLANSLQWRGLTHSPCLRSAVAHGSSLYLAPLMSSSPRASPPSKRARLDKEGRSSGADGVQQLLEQDSADTSRTTLHFPAPHTTTGRDDLNWPTLTPFDGASGWSYDGARILAPMVRIGMLPMRLLAAEMGANMVYSEEMVAKKLATCGRVQRMDKQGRSMVDFVPGQAAASSVGTSTAHSSAATAPVAAASTNSTFVGAASVVAASPRVHNANLKSPPTLTTYAGERLVVQLGAANAADALAAAQVVSMDARAIDLNMGCPKHFSLQGGMGAALLRTPERAADILSTLRRNLNLPITCKLRLLPTDEETVELAQRLERMGVSAIALHARHIEDRPRHKASRHRVRVVADALQVPLLYNGDAFYAHELEECKAATGARGIMVARGAMWNASVFRRDAAGQPLPMLPVADVVRRYVTLATETEGHVFSNTKYCVLEMLKGQVGATELFRKLTRAKDAQALTDALAGMDAEVALTGDYTAPVQLEERPDRAAAALPGGDAHAVPVNVLLKASSHTGAGGHLSRKEQKYQAKQNRKNREGRAKDMQSKQDKKDNTSVSAPATTSEAKEQH